MSRSSARSTQDEQEARKIGKISNKTGEVRESWVENSLEKKGYRFFQASRWSWDFASQVESSKVISQKHTK
jgi:hypothetical protein